MLTKQYESGRNGLQWEKRESCLSYIYTISPFRVREIDIN